MQRSGITECKLLSHLSVDEVRARCCPQTLGNLSVDLIVKTDLQLNITTMDDNSIKKDILT